MESERCGVCGHPFETEHQFCTTCGASSSATGTGKKPWAPPSTQPPAGAAVANDMRCPHCGNTHPIYFTFCPDTGGGLFLETSNDRSAERETEWKSESTMPLEDSIEEAAKQMVAKAKSAVAEPRAVTEPEPPQQVKSRRKATLHLFEEGGEKKTFHVPQAGINVGRDNELCDLSFPGDPYVSPEHARFYYANDSLWVEDSDSLNKVFQRLRRPVQLEDGDRIRVGEHIFRFELVRRTADERKEVTKVLEGTLPLGTTDDEALARLVVRRYDGTRGKEYFIGRRAIILGAGKGTHNFMNDKRISPRHARLASIPSQKDKRSGRVRWIFRLDDLQSEHGTWRQVRSPLPLRHGDQLLIANHRLFVEYVEAHRESFSLPVPTPVLKPPCEKDSRCRPSARRQAQRNDSRCCFPAGGLLVRARLLDGVEDPEHVVELQDADQVEDVASGFRQAELAARGADLAQALDERRRAAGVHEPHAAEDDDDQAGAPAGHAAQRAAEDRAGVQIEIAPDLDDADSVSSVHASPPTPPHHLL